MTVLLLRRVPFALREKVAGLVYQMLKGSVVKSLRVSGPAW